MDTNQLKSIVMNDKYASKNFCGILPIDHLPKKKLTHDCSFIVNTDYSNGKGKHWVAIFVPNNGIIEYFDPFGMKPVNKEVYDFIKLNSSDYIYNKKGIQHLSSIKCGLFCLFFIMTRSRGIQMKKSSNFFNEISYLNDDLIDIIFKKIKLKFKIKNFI